MDFEGHLDDPKVKTTLAALEEHCEKSHVLGSFPIAPMRLEVQRSKSRSFNVRRSSVSADGR